MRFKLDENLPVEILTELRSAGRTPQAEGQPLPSSRNTCLGFSG